MKVLFYIYKIDQYLDLHLLILSIFILVIINNFFFSLFTLLMEYSFHCPQNWKPCLDMWHWKISQHAFHIIDKQIFNDSILLALENINKICSRYFAIQNVFHTTTSATLFNTEGVENRRCWKFRSNIIEKIIKRTLIYS
jgi:hypothetical protein